MIADSDSHCKVILDCNEEWSKRNGLSINKDKSGILLLQKTKGRLMRPLTEINGVRFVNCYKYLGLWINERLTPFTHISKCESKLNYVTFRLKWILKTCSLRMRKNLWSVFIRPHCEFLSIFYKYNSTQSHQTALARFINKYWKKFLCLKKRALNVIGDLCIGLDMKKRAEERYGVYINKWRERCSLEMMPIARFEETFNCATLITLPQDIISIFNLIGRTCKKCGKPASIRHIQIHFPDFDPVSILAECIKEEEEILIGYKRKDVRIRELWICKVRNRQRFQELYAKIKLLI